MPILYTLKNPSCRSTSIDFALDLNPEQYRAVTCPAGPALVIAGPGSGKTRTLTYRVAWLLEQGIAPNRILLLTFTNKSAKEMLDRVAVLTHHDLFQLWGGTFHHIGHKILRHHCTEVGLNPCFTILDQDDSIEVLRSVYTDVGLNLTDKSFPKPAVVYEVLSYCRNTQIPLQDICRSNFPHLAEFLEGILLLQKAYDKKKSTLNCVDYDDLLTIPLRLFNEKPNIAERYKYQFQAVLVDEFQDTNKIQSDLIDIFAAGHRNIMVVGDDAQSIYSWRGANFENIITFPQRYPDAQIFRIETNYRSRPEILNLANHSISINKRQYKKTLRPVKPQGSKPVVVPCIDPQQQADFVCQRVLELQQEGLNLKDIAVLYRAHSHCLELQLELSRRGIPFIITSGIQFFQQAHIKDLAAYLRIVLNPADEIAFLRVVKLVPGIGITTAKKLFEKLRYGADWTCITVPSKSQKTWKQLAELIMHLRKPQPPPTLHSPNATFAQLPAHIMIEHILEGFYANALKLQYDNASQRLDDLYQLRDFSRQFDSPQEFLSQLSLLTGVDVEQSTNSRTHADALRLTTIHQAKGLEWKVVFLIHLAEGLFPIARICEDEQEIEEERRLFYVAITRAQDQLYLTYPIIRYTKRENSLDPILRKSRFLSELPDDLFEEWQLEPPRSLPTRNLTEFPSKNTPHPVQHLPNSASDDPF